MSDGYVIHDLTSDRIHYLNPTSALIFELCDGSTPVEEIADILAENFELDSAPLQESITCVEQLLSEGLIYA